MATVIKVDGSAYRHVGAKMLIDEAGKTYGMISGGCLEGDIVYRAEEVMQSRRSQIVTYDLKSEDGAGWGQGAGCNGIIYVYMEEVGWNVGNGSQIWAAINDKLLSGFRIASIKFMDASSQTIDYIYYSEDGEFLSCRGEEEHVNYLGTFFNSGRKVDFISTESGGNILAELYEPNECLYIFGAGPDVEPVVELASKLDFSVRIIDPRKERFKNGNFSAADQLVIEYPHTYLQQAALPPNSYVLVMTHNFQWDQKLVKYLLQKPPKYLGILGTKKRTQRLLSAETIPEWIHSPVGLNISAEGPEEIAVSICAELIRLRKQIHIPQTKVIKPRGIH